MRRKRVGLLAIALTSLILVGYACSGYVPPDSEMAAAEQYAAYSSYLNSRITLSSDVGGIGGRTIFICSDPTTLHQEPVWRFFAIAFRGLNGNIGTAYSLFLLNVFTSTRRTYRFDRRFGLVQPYELEELSDLPFELADHRRQSIFVFSRVAFNNDLDLGLFYARHHCGSLCGDDWYVIVRKINGKWAVAGQSLMGVS